MEPPSTTGTGSQNNVTSRVLSQASDFGRSRNLGVLLNDQGLKRTYLAAEAEGELPSNRARVLILGEPRAGKTSLLNRLLGREFDLLEQSTHGIETRMCHVTNVDKQWNESGGAKADDIRECAAAVAVLKEASEEGMKTEQIKKSLPKFPSASSNSSESPSGSDTSLNEKIWQLSVIIKIMLIIAVIQWLNFAWYGFAGLAWISILATATAIDYNNAYRFATSATIVCVLLEATIRNDQPLEEVACEASDSSQFSYYRPFQLLSKSIMLNVFHTSVVGISTGLGFRTGIAVALAMSIHPWELQGTTVQGVASWNMEISFLIFAAGGTASFYSYKFCTTNNRWHKRRTLFCCALFTLTYAVYLGSVCWLKPYWFIFLNGCLMLFVMTWGSIFGRRLVLKHGFQANYLFKKFGGFCIGVYLAYMCGWSWRVPEHSLTSWAIYIVSVASHPLFDAHIAIKIWLAEETFPVKMIRKQMKANIQGQPLLETKLSLWDFAGDTLYHCTHHVFMPDRALYVIVFNLEAAVSDEDEQLQKLLFWLHSVCAHARHKDARIMIVGTHKASVLETEIKCFTDKIPDRMDQNICSRIVHNPVDNKPLFLVENSERLDEDFQQLRAEIFKRVESAEYAQEKYPIKYFHFYKEIQNRRKLAQTSDFTKKVATLKEIQILARETCEVEGEEDLKKMLRYFCEAGEIIYREEDEILRNHVVFSPQFLVDVMKKLMHVPRECDRCHRFAIDWRDYKNTGIISEELLRHIYRDMSELVPLFTLLLKAYDLMCPLTFAGNTNCRPNDFLVPAMLPSHTDETKLWKSQSTEEVFYFDFGYFDPRTVYCRLLTRCLTHFCSDKMETDSKPLIFADRCRLYIGACSVFKLQLEKRSFRKQLLSVTVLIFEPDDPCCELLEFLVEAVTSIIKRDFPQLSFTFGPRCNICAKSQSSRENDDDIHVLQMATRNKPFPKKPPVGILCGQQRCEFSLSPWKTPEPLSSPSHPPQRVAFGPETLITKIPADLFSMICCRLNTREQRNWKTLAGELGKDVEFVVALDSERVTNPSKSLLMDWAMEGGVTVADLFEVLERPSLERNDIVQEVRAQMK